MIGVFATATGQENHAGAFSGSARREGSDREFVAYYVPEVTAAQPCCLAALWWIATHVLGGMGAYMKVVNWAAASRLFDRLAAPS